MRKMRIGSKVCILSEKNDGSFDFGKVIGIELKQRHFYIGAMSLQDYFRSFDVPYYLVAYKNNFNNRFYNEWFSENEISNKKPK